MMKRSPPLEVVAHPVSDLTEYRQIPIAFTVDRILEVTPIDNGLGGLLLEEATLDLAYVKDYDAIPGNAPECWPARWDISNWGMITGQLGGSLVGGAVLAFGTKAVELLENRTDLAVLWDLRVHPDHRHRGVGQAIFRAAVSWARARGCRQIKAETQNINVAACRFYAREGCILGAINRLAYPEFPSEVQLIWYKFIASGGCSFPPSA
jgi:GNAT superfamily N-acetyltransferase